MAITTIPWNDGSGDNIYLSYPAASGAQTVQVTSDANAGASRSKTVVFESGVGGLRRELTVSQSGAYNFRIFGSPTIANGIMSLTGQSERNFIYTKDAFAPGSADFSIQTSVRYNSFQSYRDVFASVNDDGSRLYSIVLQSVVSNGVLSNRLYLSSNGTSWNKMNGTRRVNTSVTGEWRDFKVERVSNVFRVYIRERGGEWAFSGSSTVTGITFNSPIAFGGGFANAELNGDIDLTETKIYIGGQLWWMPFN